MDLLLLRKTATANFMVWKKGHCKNSIVLSKIKLNFCPNSTTRIRTMTSTNTDIKKAMRPYKQAWLVAMRPEFIKFIKNEDEGLTATKAILTQYKTQYPTIPA